MNSKGHSKVLLKLLWNSKFNSCMMYTACQLVLLRIELRRVGQKLNSLSDYGIAEALSESIRFEGVAHECIHKSFATVKLVHSWSCTLPLAQTRAGCSLFHSARRWWHTYIHSRIKGPWRRERSKAAPGDKYTQSEPFGQFALNAGKWEQTRWEKGRDCE